MSIRIRLARLESPVAQGYIPVVAGNGRVGPKRLIRLIAGRSSVSAATVSGVLFEVSAVVQQELEECRSVALEGIGILSLRLQSTPAATPGEFDLRTHVKGTKIRFKASLELRLAQQAYRFEMDGRPASNGEGTDPSTAA